MADEELDGATFDVVFMGTGLTECVLSGIVSAKGKKVLHTDKNDYYGGETASLKPAMLFEMFPAKSDAETQIRQEIIKNTRSADWNIDLMPKMMMFNGFLTDIINFTKVTRYLQFSSIQGSYILDSSNNPQKIPTTPGEAARFGYVGFFEKNRLRQFFNWVQAFDSNNLKTYFDGYSPNFSTMDEVYNYFALEGPTKDFLGHAMALHTSDNYLTQRGQSVDTINRIKLYASSVIRCAQSSQTRESPSPYIYPFYGMGDVPQAFARLSSIYGGTFTLNTKLLELHLTDGAVSGVTMEMVSFQGKETFTVKCDKLVADPSYFPQYTEPTIEYVARAICLLKDAALDKKVPKGSMQLIIHKPKDSRDQVRNDIYVARLDSALKVSPNGYSIGIVTTICAENDIPERVLRPGLDIFGNAILVKLIKPPTSIYKPLPQSKLPKGLYLSRSCDASTHFESTTDNIKELYETMYGESIDLLFSRMDQELRSAEFSLREMAEQV